MPHPGSPVARLSEIPRGEGRIVEVGGLQMAVFHTRDGVFATQPDCPHRGGPLADGLSGSRAVLCPLHDRIFDLRTGAGLNSACRITTYAVRVDEAGMIRLADPPDGLRQA